MKHFALIGHLNFANVIEEFSDGAEEDRGLQPAGVTTMLMG
jgi:hypothetical protein